MFFLCFIFKKSIKYPNDRTSHAKFNLKKCYIQMITHVT